MKSYRKIVAFIAIALVSISTGCKDDDFPVPLSSTQALFSYVVNIVDTNEGSVFEVSFINESIGAKSFSWDFGNGQTSTEENPVITYSTEGDYIVTLSVTSDTDLHYNKLEATQSIKLIFKETILMETFDGEGAETPETWLPENWLALDADGDGANWYWSPGDGNGQMRSQSWDGVPLNVDNWLITSEIDLSVITDNEVWLSFNVRPSANTPAYRQENYGIFVSKTGSTVSDFPAEAVWSERLTSAMSNVEYQFREIDLSEFAGEKIRIAFRHYESSDNDRIVFDNVEVYKKL